MKPSTIAVHAGSEPEVETGAVIAPIYQTSTFKAGARGKIIYEYTRAGNPNFTRLEEAIAGLEGAKYGAVFGSGLGALTALISTLKTGDHVLAGEDLYGGTFRLLTQVFDRFGITATFVPASDIKAWDGAFRKKTRLVIIESPTNPLLEIADIAEICKSAKRRGIMTAVDNTFATPVFQKPLSLGADVSLHSTTKYIGGHSDVIGGAIATNTAGIKEKLDFARKAIGLNPSPFDCWLTSRGLKTLPIRMERHEKNAFSLAKFLKKHPAVAKVIYPGLPAGQLARKQMSGFGGMVSVRLRAARKDAEKGFMKLALFMRAESLGGVESLISHPATQTHASLSPAERKRRGITDDLWRISVGIEDADDLIADMKTALDAM